MPCDSIPIGLRNALESGNCVLFVGSGIGFHAHDKAGRAAPDAATLAAELIAEFALDVTKTTPLAKVAKLIELRKGRAELQSFLSQRLRDLEPDTTLRWLATLTWKAIFTTNYDRVLERAYELEANPPQTPVPISATASVTSCDPRFQLPIYHIHGSLFDVPHQHVVITTDDYIKFRERRRMLFEQLKYSIATSPILYLGYSHNDQDWQLVMTELAEDFQPSAPPPSYRVAPSTDPVDKELLDAQGIATIDCDLTSFVTAASTALGEVRVDPRRLAELGRNVPPDLHPAFDANAAATLRLLGSWQYVNQQDFHSAPNVAAFLKGDQPNWPLLAQRMHFERDIEDPLVDSLLDYATTPHPTQPVLLVSGPAGYGITTLLRSACARLSEVKAGAVFIHRTGTPLLPADVEFACAAVSGQRIFVIDNAADNPDAVIAMHARAREEGRSACFLLGERKNEWLQAHVRLRSKEFGIEPLSDAEIDRLLACLNRNGALGKLAALTPDLQRAAVREKHEKELLVALREATEGKLFNAIIEDEYGGLGEPLAKRAYAIVCGFYRHRVQIRDLLLAELLQVGLPEYYKATTDALEGVVRSELIDDATDTYASRARHHIIAEIVWERCMPASDRDALMLDAVERLNLNYHLDAVAFREFVAAAASAAISTVEGRIRFFETACRKDPRSPYVRQHYARMLLTDKFYDAALQQIDQGITIDSQVRVLHHTKGMVLQEMALDAESEEIGRRRLAQSEEAFRTVINMKPQDSYGYHGLAELYWRWARRTHDPGDAMTYLAKAEEVVGEAFRQVRDREWIYVVSSEIQKVLGNAPAAEVELAKATREKGASGYARYLLGREYLRRGEPEKAVEVLEPVVAQSPNEHRNVLIYALALYDGGESLKRCIAALRLGSLYGMRDPKYVATLGGMLFTDGDFTEAEEVFAEATRQGFTYWEKTTIHFEPHVGGERTHPIELEGTVVTVKRGFSFVGAPGYPEMFCPASKYAGTVMRVGLRIRFVLAFTARGPVALRPTPVKSEIGAPT